MTAIVLLSRLQIDAADWKTTLEKLVGTTKTIGSYFGSQNQFREVADQRGCRHSRNVTGNQTILVSSNVG